MHLAISILVILFCFYKKKSKIILFLSLIWLWYLMSFSIGLPDEVTNMSRYYQYNNLVGQTEVGYYYLMVFANRIGLSFDIYKCLIAAIELALIGSTIYKFNNNNVVIGLYLIFPFCMDVVQMRNTLSLAIIVFGLRYILAPYSDSGTTNKKNTIKYVVCVFFAGLFHSMNYLNILLLFAKKAKTKTIIIYTAVFSIFFTSLIQSNLLYNIFVLIGIADKVGNIQATGIDYGLYINSLARVIVFFLTFIIDYLYIKKVMKFEGKLIDSDFVLKANILVLSIIALMSFSVDFYRLQTGLSIMNYLFFVEPLKKIKDGKVKKKDIVLIFLLIVTCICNLYWLVLRSNFDSVFKPIFLNFK